MSGGEQRANQMRQYGLPLDQGEQVSRTVSLGMPIKVGARFQILGSLGIICKQLPQLVLAADKVLRNFDGFVNVVPIVGTPKVVKKV